MKSKFWKSKKVLVTGGAGFIGSHVVEKLVAREAVVSVLDNLQNGSFENLENVKSNYSFIEGDCTDSEVAGKACRGQDIASYPLHVYIQGNVLFPLLNRKVF
ncbi:MAG: NAD-dependent epimerase/dehydratase [Candidatus Levybacteria bacterium GW2011_GWB1_36_18]|nr:MAG: NAD-dependent epimerase/dehydratase [Candidatus Levybacteria bacterium GW2011_GWB1_36_18]